MSIDAKRTQIAVQECSKIFSVREAKLINELVALYRKGELNPDLMYSKVAAIAAMRSLLKDIENG